MDEVPRCSLVSDCSLPDPPRQGLTKEQLSPPTKNCYINSKEEAFHPNLQETCLNYPIVIIRGLNRALQLDLSLFETKTLVKTNPKLSIERRYQMRCISDQNWDETRKEKVWEYSSYIQHTTIRQYAKYQAKILRENNQENMSDNILNSDSTDSTDQMTEPEDTEWVKFATNVDISIAQSKKWKPQINELTKLPPFLRVKCDDNMLNYIDYDILGMNTVQLYMKV